MDIADIATQDYVEVDAEERLGRVRALFDDRNPKGIVVTDDGEYAGVVTQKQLLQSHVENHTKARALARTAPKVRRTEDVRDTARMLVEGDVKIAPVFEGDDLWGVVTEDAILDAVLEGLDAITVGDIYTENPVTVAEDTTIGRVINLMREHGISRLPVVDREARSASAGPSGDEPRGGRLTGIVTTHDIVDVVVRDVDKTTVGDRAGDLDRVLDLPASDVMSSPVETVTVEDTVRAAVETMLDNDYAGLVVTPEGDDRAVDGVLTKTDVLRALSYTEEDAMDVQITNVHLLDSISRDEVRSAITEIADKYREMQVLHAHVRLHKHKEKLRGTPLIQCQIRLRTSRGQMAGSGEGYGAESAFYVAVDKLERNVLEVKDIQADEEYRGQLLRKLGEL